MRSVHVAIWLMVGVSALAGAPASAQQPDEAIELFGPAEASGEGPAIENSGARGGASAHRVLRLKYVRRGQSILVEATAQGRPVYFLLDTGASSVTLTPEFARQIGVAPEPGAPKIRMNTANGQRIARVGRLPQLMLGGRAHRDVTFLTCSSCGQAASGLDRPVVGLLGMNVLGRYRMNLDDAQGVVELTPSRGSPKPRRRVEPDAEEPSSAPPGEGPVIEVGARGGASASGVVRLKYVRRGRSILVEAKAQGRPVYFLLDTGASYTTLTPGFARRAGVTPGPDAPKMRMNTANGQRVARLGLLPRLELGGRSHHNVTFSTCPSCGGRVPGSDRPVVGLLGMNVLRRYRMDMDDAHGLIELTPSLRYQERGPDIEPWLDVQPRRFHDPQAKGGLGGIRVQVRNRSPRQVRGARVKLRCILRDGTPLEMTSPPFALRPGQADTRDIEVEKGLFCKRWTGWDVEGARW